MTGDLGTYVVFALGILVGGILFNKDFRVKFFKGLREFLGQIGRGAREQNKRQAGGRGELRREVSAPREKEENTETIRRKEYIDIYKEEHKSKTCPVCQGSGRVYEKASPLQEGAPGFKPRAITCPECEGEGKVWS